MNKEIILNTCNIVKEFPGVRALDGVNFELRKGELLALVGENGAGKSTLMKILSGVYPEYEGEVYIKGNKAEFKGTKDAEKAGIAIIHQELNLITELTVMENIFLGSEPRKGGVFIDYKKMWEDTQALLMYLELDNISPGDTIKELSVGKQQMIEIAKAISKNAEVLIFDEPTSALSKKEAESLFTIIDNLKMKKGVSIIYISHRMEEIFSLPDRISVLRDGASIGTWDRNELNHDTLVKHMVGRDISKVFPEINNKQGDVILKLKDYWVNHPLRVGEKIVHDINLEIREGEVLGIAGLMGSGRTELVESIFGAFPTDTGGEMYLYGEKVNFKSPKDAITKGLGLVTEDRKALGLVLQHSVAHNMTLSVINSLKKLFIIDEKREKEIVDKYVGLMKIKTPNNDFKVNNLSGGNQQKVVIGKALATRPKILIMDEPTRGIDIGAKSEIYNIIKDLAESGVTVIMVSSDLPEVMELSDRIAVMHKGSLQKVISAKGATQEQVMRYATGGK